MTGYLRPAHLEEALRELAAAPSAVPLAGGTDLVLQRRAGEIRADRIVDLKAIPNLSGECLTRDVRRVGALTTMAALASARGGGDALSDGASVVGSPQTRQRATLGGNICRSSPAGDTLPALLVLNARLELVSAAGIRYVTAADFFTGPGLNVKARDELLAAIELPLRRGRSAYRRLTYRAWMDLAVIGVAACVDLRDGTCVDASVAIGGAAPTPMLVPGAAAALVGTDVGLDAIKGAAAAVADAARPIDDVRASAKYRRATLVPLTSRAVTEAIRRAAPNNPKASNVELQ